MVQLVYNLSQDPPNHQINSGFLLIELTKIIFYFSLSWESISKILKITQSYQTITFFLSNKLNYVFF